MDRKSSISMMPSRPVSMIAKAWKKKIITTWEYKYVKLSQNRESIFLNFFYHKLVTNYWTKLVKYFQMVLSIWYSSKNNGSKIWRILFKLFVVWLQNRQSRSEIICDKKVSLVLSNNFYIEQTFKIWFESGARFQKQTYNHFFSKFLVKQSYNVFFFKCIEKIRLTRKLQIF